MPLTVGGSCVRVKMKQETTTLGKKNLVTSISIEPIILVYLPNWGYQLGGLYGLGHQMFFQLHIH